MVSAEGSGNAPTIPLFRPWIDLRDHAAVTAALASGRLLDGPYRRRLEANVAAVAGAPAAAVVSSGTVALELALRQLGLADGDEVVVPALSSPAVVHAVLNSGASPVVADVEPFTRCLAAESVADQLTDRTRAVVAVHLDGMPADLATLGPLAAGAGAALVEDAAHAVGATVAGRPVGGIGTLGLFSFQATKIVTAGNGGAVVGPAVDVSAVREAASNGDKRTVVDEQISREVVRRGGNLQLPEMSAALAWAQLERLAANLQRRSEIAAAYGAALAGLPVSRPPERTGRVWHAYVLRVEPARRDVLVRAAAAAGIELGVPHRPVTAYRAFRSLATRAQSTEAAAQAGDLISLPLYPSLTDGQVDQVVAVVASVLAASRWV